MDLEMSEDALPVPACGYDHRVIDLTAWGTPLEEPFSANPLWNSGSYLAAPNGGVSDWPGFGGFASLLPSGEPGYPTWPLAVPEPNSEICEQDSVSPTAAEDATSPTWSWSQPPSPVDTFGKATSTSPKPNPMPNPQAASRTKLATLRPSSVTKPRQGTTSLRLAGRKPRKPSATSKPAKRANAVKPASETRHDGNEKVAASDKIRARRNHNIVEKQYRNRLNAQFERLLSVLPPEQQKAPALANGQTSPSTRKRRASSSSVTVSTPEDRRLSKAEVLDVATNRIKELEADRERLLREKSDLILGIKVVGGVVAKSGVRGSAQVGS